MSIAITPAAETFMRRMVRFSNGTTTSGFRLIVSMGGCAGFLTRFTVEAIAQPDDTTIDVNGLSVFLPSDTNKLLTGATIDCNDSGLTIVNPNVRDCGCGSSNAGRGGRHAAVSVAAILRMR